MRFSNLQYAVIVLVGILALSVAVQAEMIISDSFDRSDSAIDLGSTDQGFAWKRKNLSSDDGANSPGIYGGMMRWQADSTYSVDAVYLDAAGSKVKDFVLDLDYQRLTTYGSAHKMVVWFRTATAGQLLSDGGTQGGYGLTMYYSDRKQFVVQLYSEYGISEERTVTTSGDWDAHVTLFAEGSSIKLYVDDPDRQGTAALSTVDTTANSQKDAAGYLAFYGNRMRSHAIDNLTVQAVPEPATTTLLGAGGIVLLIRKRQK